MRELRDNPHIYRILAVRAFEGAYHAVDEWDSLDQDQRKGRTEPEGEWVDRVVRIRRENLEAEFAARTDALKAEGRV